MKSEGRLDDTLRCQLAHLSKLSQHQLQAAEEAVAHTQAILAEAIERLNTSFFGIHALIRAHEQTCRQIGKPEDPGFDCNVTAGDWANAAAAHVQSAVTALQFQDISSQLLADSQRRIAGVRALLEAALPEASDKGAPAEDFFLGNALEKALARQGKSLEDLRPSPIAGPSADQGGIELF